MKRTILRPAEVAELTGVPVETLKYWRAHRKGPRSYRLEGARVVYDLADVEAWLAEQRQASGGSPAA